MTAPTTASSRQTNLLVVDDDDVDVMNVRRAFTRGGIASPIWVAHDGVEALAVLRGADYPPSRRLVLLDINMPRMNGLELLRAMRADPALQSTTVVVLSTSDDERDRIDAYRLNVAGYLVKPATFPDFVDVMVAFHRYWTLAELT